MQLFKEPILTEKFHGVAGVDEAGRGPLAGPVTASCVVFPPGYKNPEIGDSKKISPEKRERLFDVIQRDAIACPAVSVGPRRIDILNIRQATRFAMRAAVERAAREVALKLGIAEGDLRFQVLIDGNMTVGTVHHEETIIKGDATVLQISAASIVAKVTRDRLMQEISRRYPNYCFNDHKGYGTPQHLRLVQTFGPSAIHRFTFAGVREYLPPDFAAQFLRPSKVVVKVSTQFDRIARPCR